MAGPINKDLAEDDMNREEIEKDQVITHKTCAIDPSFITKQMQNEERHVTNILHTSPKSSQTECSTSSAIQPTTKKSLK